MNQKESPCANRGNPKTSVKDKKRVPLDRGKVNSVSFFNRGVELHKEPFTRSGQYHGGVRSSIVGWSTKSRARMRMFMLMHSMKSDLKEFSVTLTVPGPVMPPERCKLLFERFARELDRAGMCAVWRVELQSRGQLHWHLIVGAKRAWDITELWHDAIRSLGKETFNPPHEFKGGYYTTVSSRMAMHGAHEFSALVEPYDGKVGWYRYIADHASKGKQEQIAVSIGRHWGVIGRKRFVCDAPQIVVEMDDKQFGRYLRMNQRLSTMSRESDCVFGRRLVGRLRRGFRGRTSWFGSLVSRQNMVLLATGEHKPTGSFNAYSKSQGVTPCSR
jgi:hypothetical protein